MAVDWLPTPADVGAIIRARTREAVTGTELGTFTAKTRPTDVQTVEVIDSVVSDIESQVGTVPEQLQPFARRVAAIGAACLVELSYWPEEIEQSSQYDRLVEWYNTNFARLVTAANDINSGGDAGGGEETAFPSYGFPDESWMIGLNSRW